MEKKLEFEDFKMELSNALKISPDKITYDAVIYQDIGIDSLGLVNLGVKLQKVYNVEISAAEFIELRTVGELYECMVDILNNN